MTYVVFKNLKDGEYLPDYDASDEALAFREKFTPHHVVLPRLDEEYATELELERGIEARIAAERF